MSEQEVKSKIITLGDREAQHQRLVNELIAYMVDLDIESFERDLDSFVLTKGIKKAITRLIFPFLHRIGILWSTNHVNPAQEHLVTNIIRQKLIVGIEGAMTHKRTGKTILLFLPEGEYHELGLLYVHYLLKTHGVRVLYLGADVPLKDVEFVCLHKNPDFLYTHLTGIAGNFSLDKFLSQISQRLPNTPLVISGQLAHSQLRKSLPVVNFRRSVAEVNEFIASL
jgi:methanogenic corrinoid protein MtbC1